MSAVGQQDLVMMVADKVWAVKLPAPRVYFGHSMAYIVDTGEGLVLIDTGDGSQEAMALLNKGFSIAGSTVRDLRAILLTHTHYDHCGGAAQLRAESGAWIGMTAIEEDFLRSNPSEAGTREKLYQMCLQAGACPGHIPRPSAASENTEIRIKADRIMADGDVIGIGDWSFRVIMTPGHSPGHAAFFADSHGILFSGDHLFPVGSTLVLLDDLTARADDGALSDPFGDYLRSLDKLLREPADLVLPGHIGPFSNLHDRVDEEKARLERRVSDLEAHMGSAPTTPADIAARMRWGRGEWPDLAPATRLMAIINTITGLRALEMRGKVVASVEGERLAYARIQKEASEHGL